MLVLSVIAAVLPLSLPKLAGIKVYGVLTGSMEPEYATGGVVYVRQCDADGLQTGDVITFRLGSGADYVMTHRIVGTDAATGAFLTKGDANNSIDPEPVAPDRIIGRVVFYLPHMASVADALEKPTGIAVLLTVFIMAVVCWLLADIVKKQQKDMLRPALRLLAVVLMAGAGCYLGKTLLEYRLGEREYTLLKQEVFAEAEALRQGEEADGLVPGERISDTETTEAEKAVQSAVAQLMQDNEDVIGWIVFENPDISYPVMQGTDNEYYLSHTFSGEKNSAGSIYADVINHDDWEDAHTILYGHNMKNRSMFGSLRSYKREDFYAGNELFRIYTAQETYVYQIFACYDVAEYSDIYTVWYTPDEGFAKLLESMQRRAYYDTGVEVSAEDKILTLSTCSTEGNRFVIHAKRILPFF